MVRMPGTDPKNWIQIANVEADESVQVARITVWVVTAPFGAAIGAATYFGLATGWIVLIAFIGLATIVSGALLPLFWRLDAGRSYLDQAATVDYNERHGID